MPRNPSPRGWRILAALGILLVATNLRSAIGTLSPILDDVRGDFALGGTPASVLGMLPPLCFGLAGVLSPFWRRKATLETLLLVALAAMLAGQALRALASSSTWLVALSAVAFAGAGVGNVVLPSIVKKYFPQRIGAVTALYATAMAAVGLVPPLTAVPVADAAGWRVSIGMWALLAPLAMLPWLALWGRRHRGPAAVADDPDAVVVPPSIWRSRLAWALAVMFAMTAANVFSIFAWLPELLADTAGTGHDHAGAMLSLYAAAGLPLSIIIPVLAVRTRRIGAIIGTGTVFYVAGYAGLLGAPDALPVVWVALAAGGPLLFPLTLTLINLRTRTPDGALALSGFVQGVGYLIGAMGPLAFGLIHDATGGWTAPLVFLLVLVAAIAPCGVVVARAPMLEDELPSLGRRLRRDAAPDRDPCATIR